MGSKKVLPGIWAILIKPVILFSIFYLLIQLLNRYELIEFNESLANYSLPIVIFLWILTQVVILFSRKMGFEGGFICPKWIRFFCKFISSLIDMGSYMALGFLIIIHWQINRQLSFIFIGAYFLLMIIRIVYHRSQRIR